MKFDGSNLTKIYNDWNAAVEGVAVCWVSKCVHSCKLRGVGDVVAESNLHALFLVAQVPVLVSPNVFWVGTCEYLAIMSTKT